MLGMDNMKKVFKTISNQISHIKNVMKTLFKEGTSEEKTTIFPTIIYDELFAKLSKGNISYQVC